MSPLACGRLLLIGGVLAAAAAAAPPAAGRTQMSAWPLIANTVLLAEAKLPTPDEVLSRLKTSDLKFVEAPKAKAEDEQLSIDLGFGRFAQIGLMPRPVPGITESCRRVWHWKDACAAAERTQAHALVFVQANGLTRIEGALLASRVKAALATAANATAVNWGIDFHSPSEFARIANNGSVDRPPAFLWIRLGIAQSERGHTSLYTDGLELFEKRDIEVHDVANASGSLMQFVLSMAFYSLTSSREIKPGETVGRSNAERIPVELADSRFFAGKRVLRFDVTNEFAPR